MTTNHLPLTGIDLSAFASAIANDMLDTATKADSYRDAALQVDGAIAYGHISTMTNIVNRLTGPNGEPVDISPLAGMLLYNGNSSKAIELAKSTVGDVRIYDHMTSAADVAADRWRDMAIKRAQRQGKVADEQSLKVNTSRFRGEVIRMIGLAPWLDMVRTELDKSGDFKPYLSSSAGWRKFLASISKRALEFEGAGKPRELIKMAFGDVVGALNDAAEKKEERAKTAEKVKEAKEEGGKASNKADPRFRAATAVSNLIAALAELGNDPDSGVDMSRKEELEAALAGLGISTKGVVSDRDRAVAQHVDPVPEEVTSLPSAADSGALDEVQVDESAGQPTGDDFLDALAGTDPEPAAAPKAKGKGRKTV